MLIHDWLASPVFWSLTIALEVLLIVAMVWAWYQLGLWQLSVQLVLIRSQRQLRQVSRQVATTTGIVKTVSTQTGLALSWGTLSKLLFKNK